MWTTIPGRAQGFADKSDNDGPTRRLKRVEFAVRENRYAADPEPTPSISSSRCLKPFYQITLAGALPLAAPSPVSTRAAPWPWCAPRPGA